MKRFRLKVDAAIEASTAAEALEEIAVHFRAMARQVLEPGAVVPNTFAYDSQIRFFPVRLVEEEIGARTH